MLLELQYQLFDSIEICLRYLASGDIMPSLSFAFRIGISTVSKIVPETCQAIWNSLKEIISPEEQYRRNIDRKN